MKKLSPAMEAAMDQLTGTTSGKIHRGQGVAYRTARALAARELVYLEGDGEMWTMVLIEPEVQEITDAALEDMGAGEAELLRPLSPARRYRALRHAHIDLALSGIDRAAGFAGHIQSRSEALRQRVDLVLAWQRGRITDRQYGQYIDYAGTQWKSAREHVTDIWYIGTGYGEAVLTVEAASRTAAHAQADKIIAADPVGYRELVQGYGSRRITVGQLVADRRAGQATGRL